MDKVRLSSKAGAVSAKTLGNVLLTLRTMFEE
ncbi:hypothetical protein [Aquincola tertiaricarbonis]|nr:hypothetical protein [Aquincola tertiaricarbonis]